MVSCLFIIANACNSQSQKKHHKLTYEESIAINKKMVHHDAEVIKNYLKKNNIKMKETKTGLWYKIDNLGEGKKVKKGDIVQIAYKISLLDGTLCYSSDSLGLKTFKAGQGGVASGLEEGLLLMNLGSKATFIMPPHRAFGLIGDDDKILGREIIIYNVELMKLN